MRRTTCCQQLLKCLQEEKDISSWHTPKGSGIRPKFLLQDDNILSEALMLCSTPSNPHFCKSYLNKSNKPQQLSAFIPPPPSQDNANNPLTAIFTRDPTHFRVNCPLHSAPRSPYSTVHPHSSSGVGSSGRSPPLDQTPANMLTTPLTQGIELMKLMPMYSSHSNLFKHRLANGRCTCTAMKKFCSHIFSKVSRLEACPPIPSHTRSL